jgi:hypothetical protein
LSENSPCTGGGRASGSGTIDTPIVFFKKKRPILMLPNGQYKNNSIGPSLFEVAEAFNQSVFPEVIHIKDVKLSDLIQFKVGDPFSIGQMYVESGSVEVSLNETKLVFQVPAQAAIKDINGSMVSVPLPH